MNAAPSRATARLAYVAVAARNVVFRRVKGASQRRRYLCCQSGCDLSAAKPARQPAGFWTGLPRRLRLPARTSWGRLCRDMLPLPRGMSFSGILKEQVKGGVITAQSTLVYTVLSVTAGQRQYIPPHAHLCRHREQPQAVWRSSPKPGKATTAMTLHLAVRALQ